MGEKEFFTVDEVAAKFQLNPFTVRRWIWQGKLKAKLFGTRVRIPADELATFIENQDWSLEACRERTARPHAQMRSKSRKHAAARRSK